MHLVVIGGGIVGMACAMQLITEGHSVTVLDWTPDGERCSHGNAGGIAVTEVIPTCLPGTMLRVPGWLIDPLGPLYLRPDQIIPMVPWFVSFLRSAKNWRSAAAALTSLNAISAAAFARMMALLGLSDDLRSVGAITVYSSTRGYEADRLAWQQRRELGIPFDVLSPDQLGDLEPSLAGKFPIGLFLPSWQHVVEPRRILDRLHRQFQVIGGRVHSAKVVDIERHGRKVTAIASAEGASYPCEGAVIAAGAYSSDLTRLVGDPVLLVSERGYNTTLPESGVSLSREVIFGDCNFVMTPLEMGLRIGGAAEFARLASKPNYARSVALVRLARRFFPELNDAGAHQWMGNRPATPDGLPVIGRASMCDNLFHAFGHGHLGLTQSAATAELVGNMIAGRAQPIDVSPFSVSRFA
jgi:D-amino-acid dehydrogenase